MATHYKVVIIKMEDNPNFKEEMAKWENNNMGYRQLDDKPRPQDSFPKDALQFIATEEQFDAIRKAALEKF